MARISVPRGTVRSSVDGRGLVGSGKIPWGIHIVWSRQAMPVFFRVISTAKCLIMKEEPYQRLTPFPEQGTNDKSRP